MAFEHIEIERDGHVGLLWLNRPEKLNALSEDMWVDVPQAVAELDGDDGVRVVVVAGRGPAFTVGIDVSFLASLRPDGSSQAMVSREIYETVIRLQGTINCLAETAKPVIAAVQGYCLGAGVNLISACDIRLAADDALFSIRETKMGLVADVGALQRLPAIVGNGVTAEMALTGADYPAPWALEKGLVTRVYGDHESLMAGALGLATEIAGNSPLVTQGVKRVIQANDGRTLEQSLDFMAHWNSAFLLSNDFGEAITAFMERREPDYDGT